MRVQGAKRDAVPWRRKGRDYREVCGGIGYPIKDECYQVPNQTEHVVGAKDGLPYAGTREVENGTKNRQGADVSERAARVDKGFDGGNFMLQLLSQGSFFVVCSRDAEVAHACVPQPVVLDKSWQAEKAKGAETNSGSTLVPYEYFEGIARPEDAMRNMAFACRIMAVEALSQLVPESQSMWHDCLRAQEPLISPCLQYTPAMSDVVAAREDREARIAALAAEIDEMDRVIVACSITNDWDMAVCGLDDRAYHGKKAELAFERAAADALEGESHPIGTARLNGAPKRGTTAKVTSTQGMKDLFALHDIPGPSTLVDTQMVEPEFKSEDTDDLFEMFVDQEQLASDGLEVLFNSRAPARARDQDENAGGKAPNSKAGTSEGPSMMAAQTPGEGHDADGVDTLQASDGRAGPEHDLQDDRSETSSGGRQIATTTVDSPLATTARDPTPTGVVGSSHSSETAPAPPRPTGSQKRRADDVDEEEGQMPEPPKRQRVAHKTNTALPQARMQLDDAEYDAGLAQKPGAEVLADISNVESVVPASALPCTGTAEAGSALRIVHEREYGAARQTVRCDDSVGLGVAEQSMCADNGAPGVDHAQPVEDTLDDSEPALPFYQEDCDEWAEHDSDEGASDDDKASSSDERPTQRGRKKKTSNTPVAGRNAQKHDTKRTRPYFAYKALWEERAPQIKDAAKALVDLSPKTPVSELPGPKTLSVEDKARLKQLAPGVRGRTIHQDTAGYITCAQCRDAFDLHDERIRNKTSAINRHKKEYHCDSACSACGMPIAGRDTKHFRMHRKTCAIVHALVKRGCYWEWMMFHNLVNPRATKKARGDEFFDSNQKHAAKHAADPYEELHSLFDEAEIDRIRETLGLPVQATTQVAQGDADAEPVAGPSGLQVVDGGVGDADLLPAPNAAGNAEHAAGGVQDAFAADPYGSYYDAPAVGYSADQYDAGTELAAGPSWPQMGDYGANDAAMPTDWHAAPATGYAQAANPGAANPYNDGAVAGYGIDASGWLAGPSQYW
ncbi:hypothetical protein AURDEDRAFT_122611 [Auricularia subglabra TFB-10046 SS5]|nr:hypothetical protein AURDEDRAFT_122611 [Auricularia subglabra TFB-10046 SS5]